MANPEQLDILKQGVKVWNQWRAEHPDIRPDLNYADLSYANLSHADLSYANLSHATLDGTDLVGAELINTDLRGADLFLVHLSEAILIKANLSEANLSCAELSGARLSEANLSKANLRGADLRGGILIRTNLSEANLSEANLSGADLSHADLIYTNLHKAILTNCRVYGASVWDVDLTEAEQSSLIITDFSKQPSITVDDLEVAQFIYLLLNHQKLRNVLNAVTAKGVLILGRFGGGGLGVLHAIAAKLRSMSYLPMIFDFERPHDHDYTETVKTLIGMVRFVIVDLSGPSVPQELSHTVPFFDIPFVPILEKGEHSYSMFRDLLKYDWVLRPPLEFATVDDLIARMPTEVIAAAEEKHQARQKLLDELFKKA